MPRSGSYLGSSLGCRDPDHIARWIAAMNAGKAKLHCTATAKTTEASVPQGSVEIRRPLRPPLPWGRAAEVDELRLVWLQRTLCRRFFNVRERAALEAQVSEIKRRALRWCVEDRPDAFGLDDRPRMSRPSACLRVASRIADVEPDTLTPRAFDHCLWAAGLCPSRRYDEETALLKVTPALQAEARWRAKIGQEP